MIVGALGLFAVYLLIGFGVRTWVQWRRTGDTGFRGISGRPLSTHWWAGVLFATALVAGLLGPVTGLAGLETFALLTDPLVQGLGVVLAVLGTVATFLTQLDMGTSWRIGVDASEKTDLVTAGAFERVRNPIFTAMTITGFGLALMVPNVVALTGLVLLLVALELQVRVVEEPYLFATHGPTYARYAADTGRFIPGVGRIAVVPRDEMEVS